MHKDPYENIYMVVRGTKTFTLLPPTEGYCIHGSSSVSLTHNSKTDVLPFRTLLFASPRRHSHRLQSHTVQSNSTPTPPTPSPLPRPSP